MVKTTIDTLMPQSFQNPAFEKTPGSGRFNQEGKGQMFFNDFKRFYHLKNNKGRC